MASQIKVTHLPSAQEQQAASKQQAGAQVKQPQPQPRTRPWALGLVSMVLGLILWLIGTRFTLEGWVSGINLGLELARIPARIPRPSGWWYLLGLPLGVLYSIIEVRLRIPPFSPQYIGEWLLVLFVFLFIHATDIGSTFLGYLFPGSDAWALHRWMANTSVGLFFLLVWSTFLTYVPERAILRGWDWFSTLWK